MFTEKNNNFSYFSVVDPNLSNPSHIEYLVCTSALENIKANPVLGFTLLQSPSGIVLILASGQIVSLNVISNPNYARRLAKALKPSDVLNSFKSSADSLFSDQFESHITNILSAGATQPILKLNNGKEFSEKESLELLLSAFQTLCDQHITRHDKVRVEFEKRLKILRLLQQQQQLEIIQLLNDQNQIRSNAERLAERYEEANDRQQELVKRLHDLLRLINMKLPRMAVVEKNFGSQVDKINNVTNDLERNIGMLKKNIEKQQLQITSGGESNKKKVHLPEKQESTIKEAISNM